MIPDNITFMTKINLYKKEETWSHKDSNQKKDALADLKILVLENMNNIESCMNLDSHRKALSELSDVIKVEFPDNQDAAQIANTISQHVNNFLCNDFFNHDDPVKHIISFLTPGEKEIKGESNPNNGLHAVELVSKKFYKLASEVKKEWMQNFRISLKNFGVEKVIELIEYIKKNNYLSVSLKDYPDFSDEDLVLLFEKCPNIQRIDISETKITDKGLKLVFAVKRPNLTDFFSKSCQYLTDTVIEAIAKNCSNIQSLMLYGCQNVTDKGVIEIAKHCHKLSSVNFSLTGVTDKGILALTENCPIKVLHLWGCQNVTDAGGKALTKLSDLEEINIGKTDLTGKLIKSIFESCSKLHQINICLAGVKGEEFKKFTKKYQNVESINLSWNEVTYEIVKGLIENCPNLKTIDITSTNVIDEEFEELIKTYPHLEILYSPGKLFRDL